MDPFERLPLELAVGVLRFVEPLSSLRPFHLVASLLVSKRWNSVAMQPDLWRDVSLYTTVSDAVINRLLGRAQGCLRSLHLEGNISSSSIWNGAVQQATSCGGLVDVTLHFDEETFSPEMVPKIAEAVGSPWLRRIRIYHKSDVPVAPLLACFRTILERAVALEHLILDLEAGSLPEAWMPSPAVTSREHGIRPLENLKKLNITRTSPLLWEHLSRLGVKLVGVCLGPGYCSDELAKGDPSSSSRLIQDVLDVIRGPQLLELEYFRERYASPTIADPIQATFFEHPRRVVRIWHLDYHTGISQASLSKIEKMSLYSPRSKPFSRIFSFPLPRLRHLELGESDRDDASVARAILAVSQTLQSLALFRWKPRKKSNQSVGFGVDQTLFAIGTAQSFKLRRLKLLNCECFSHATLEPLLVGNYPTQRPLWANIREVSVYSLGDGDEADEDSEQDREFTMRLRESVKRRFPHSGLVNDIPVW
jgi:hypothetical protein